MVLLKEAYDIEYCLYNHDDPELNHPLQYHLMTEKKMVKKFGLYRDYLRRYHDHQIQKFFGISFTEFIGLPIDKVEDMLAVSNEIAKTQSKIMSEAMNEAGSTISKLESMDKNQSNQTGLTFNGPYG